MLITISREYGAGGSEVARLVAAELGWSVVDNEIIDRVAARAGLTPAEVAEREERVPGFVERLTLALAASSQEFFLPTAVATATLDEAAVVRYTEMIVKEVAVEGRAVLVGRAAPAVLGAGGQVLHARVVARREFRVHVAMDRFGYDAKAAERILDDTDRNRERYHRQYYHRDWRDPTLYHMTLNTELLGFDGAAGVIVARAHRMGW
jgi:cytidylate kinase